MNREDIIRMAREQGLPETATEGLFIVNSDDLGRMLAAEREACAQVCEAGVHNAEDWDSSYWDQCCNNRAAAIRTRGNT